MTERRSGVNALVGLGAYGSALTGLLGLIGAVVSFLDGELMASGIFLLAAAIAFGFLAKAVFGG